MPLDHISQKLWATQASPFLPFFLSTMQRSMSYRKPVPTYIPSPSSSPRQSTFLPSTQPKLDLGVPPVRIYFFCSLLFLGPYYLLLAANQLAWGFGPSWHASSETECWIVSITTNSHWGMHRNGHDRASLISHGKSHVIAVPILPIMCDMFFESLVRQLNCLRKPSGFPRTKHSINLKCSMDAKTSFASSMHYYPCLDLSESSLLAIPSTNTAYSVTTQITTIFTEFRQ